MMMLTMRRMAQVMALIENSRDVVAILRNAVN